MTSNGCLQLQLSHQFVGQYYIEVSEDLQTILKLPKFLYTVRLAQNNVYIDSNHNTAANLYGDGFTGNFLTNGVGAIPSFIVNSEIPLLELDQRESIDVYSTFPMRSKIIITDSSEEHEHILFRLPYAEQHTFSSGISFTDQTLVNNMCNLEEDMEIGLIDLCDKHAETLHQTLLPGRIRNVQLRIAVRYKATSGVVERDMDFTDGLWYLRLLFVKKV